MKKIILKLLPIMDLLLVVFVYPAAWMFKNIRRIGVHRLPACKNALLKVGVFPIRNHYYEPQFDYRNSTQDFSQDRNLPGIRWNIAGQLELLERFGFGAT